MAPKMKFASQSEEHSDDWYFQRARIFDQRHFQTGKTLVCFNCHAHFTKASNFQWQAQRCAKGETIIYCPAERVEAPLTAFEKAFYPKHSASQESLQWFEQEAEQQKIHIHHTMCGHGDQLSWFPYKQFD